MSRKEARLAREAERQIKQNSKNVRLRKVVEEDRSPRVDLKPTEERTPRAVESQDSIMQSRMSFKMFDYADREGCWSWKQERNWCTPAARTGAGCIMRNSLNELSNSTWAELLSHTTGGRKRHKKHHSQQWDTLCDEAQSRWIEIGRDEEELFRFRVGGKQRIWGVRVVATFYVVWWDEEHKIYPVEID